MVGLAKISPSGVQRRWVEYRLSQAGFTSDSLRLGPDRVFCYKGGEGPPVLLLHGFGVGAVWQWHSQLRVLGKRHTVLAPDLLFFGASASDNTPSLDSQTDMVGRLLDHYGIDVCDVVGLSYGGFVGWKFAVEHPERVRRLTITSAPASVVQSGDLEGLLSRFEVSSLEELFLPTRPEGVRTLIQIAAYRAPPVPRFALVDALENLFRVGRAERALLLQDMLTRMDDPLRKEIPPQPTLLLWGAHDAVFPVGLAHKQLALMKGATLKIMKRTAHAPNLERARRYNRLVLDWLA